MSIYSTSNNAQVTSDITSQFIRLLLEGCDLWN